MAKLGFEPRTSGTQRRCACPLACFQRADEGGRAEDIPGRELGLCWSWRQENTTVGGEGGLHKSPVSCGGEGGGGHSQAWEAGAGDTLTSQDACPGLLFGTSG